MSGSVHMNMQPCEVCASSNLHVLDGGVLCILHCVWVIEKGMLTCTLF